MKTLRSLNFSTEDDMTRSSPPMSSTSETSIHNYAEIMTEFPELPGYWFEYRVEVPPKTTSQLSQFYDSEDDMTRSSTPMSSKNYDTIPRAARTMVPPKATSQLSQFYISEDDMTRSSTPMSSKSETSIHNYAEIMTQFPELPGQWFECRVEVPPKATSQLSQFYISEDDMTRSSTPMSSKSETSIHNYAEIMTQFPELPGHWFECRVEAGEDLM
ncbi:uncharacterized protein LOC122931359 [Bufo gargarizans]|uniref:uncharacterized protein LOC122931359 n=1 Tax=Bufo gargarizans TaxID=30331 RepID=UPI001CF2977E|nr:uncharacterized protein LOC122931359 [Bufo gargarizans]